MNETRVLSLGQEDPLAKGMATYSSILAWEIPWTGEPGKDAVSTWHCKDWTLLSNCNRLHESPLLHLPLSLGFSGTSSQFIKLQLLLQKDFKGEKAGTSLAIQWLRLHVLNAGCKSSIPGQGTTIPQSSLRSHMTH